MCKYFLDYDVENRLSIMSLNTNGIKTNYNYLNKAIWKYDIIVLQETMSINTKKIKDAFRNNNRLKFFNKKATKTNIKGRGSGGLSFIVNSKYSPDVDFPSDRIGVLRIENLAIVNVYMPCFKLGDYDKMELYMREINKLIKCHKDLRSKGYKIIITGDFNIDHVNQGNSNDYEQMFNSLLSQLKLSCADVEISQQINYTFKTAQTWLDHVLVEEEMFNNIDVRIKEDYNCKSDHFPTIIETSFEKRTITNKKQEKYINHLPKHILNSAAFRSNFQGNMKIEIQRLSILFSEMTHEMNENTDHKMNITRMVYEFYESLKSSINKAKSSRTQSETYKYCRNNSWWSDHAQILFDEKEALEKLKSNDTLTKKLITTIKRILEGIKNNWEKRGIKGKLTKLNINFKHEKTNFWKSLKRNNTVESDVDLTTDELKDEFERLFTTKLINTADDEKLKTEINDHINNSANDLKQNINISYELVQDLIEKLPNNKANGHTGLNNEILKLSCRTYENDLDIFKTNVEMVTIIRNIFQYIFDYMVFPDNFNTSEMFALVKDTLKSSSDINNIRGISVSDVLTNLFEKIMLTKINEKCTNNKKQFGFSQNASCGHAVFVLKETMQIVKLRKKKMYATAIDASKAFDKVNRQLLWQILIKKIGVKLTWLLMKYYDISRAYVTNKNESSVTFKTTIGVKQGGPLSPRLFAIYIQDLEPILDSTGIGVVIGDMKINLLLYADDIVLVSQTKREMQHLIDTVEEFGALREIKFNPNKTNYIGVNEYSNIKSKQYLSDIKFMRMGGEIIDGVQSLKYLGSYLSNNLLNKVHLEERYRLTSAAVKKLVDFSGFHNRDVSIEVKLQLYKAYVRPVLTYGLESLLLGSGEADKLQTKEENIIKTALGLSTRLRSSELMLALKLNRIDSRLDSMLPGYFLRLLNNEYTNDYIEQLRKLDLPNKSVAKHMFVKFKTTNRQELIKQCESYKNVIDKNFEYELNEFEMNSDLPNLIKDFKNNLGQIIYDLRAF
jgi:hypothetical protein